MKINSSDLQQVLKLFPNNSTVQFSSMNNHALIELNLTDDYYLAYTVYLRERVVGIDNNEKIVIKIETLRHIVDIAPHSFIEITNDTIEIHDHELDLVRTVQKEDSQLNAPLVLYGPTFKIHSDDLRRLLAPLEGDCIIHRITKDDNGIIITCDQTMIRKKVINVYDDANERILSAESVQFLKHALQFIQGPIDIIMHHESPFYICDQSGIRFCVA